MLENEFKEEAEDGVKIDSLAMRKLRTVCGILERYVEEGGGWEDGGSGRRGGNAGRQLYATPPDKYPQGPVFPPQFPGGGIGEVGFL